MVDPWQRVRRTVDCHWLLADVVLASVTGQTRLQKRLYGSLLLAEKLPDGVIGAALVASARRPRPAAESERHRWLRRWA
jgi:hypothetical protein